MKADPRNSPIDFIKAMQAPEKPWKIFPWQERLIERLAKETGNHG